MHQNNLLPDYISAYRANYSTESVLLKLTSDILMAMEREKITALVACDLSAAFDTVYHNILLNLLSSSFNIWGQALQRLNRCLRGRQTKVQIGSTMSQKLPLPYSVPQRSCAGPVLFNIYVSTLSRFLTEERTSDQKIKPYLLRYADDHCAFEVFEPDSREDQAS